MKSTLAPIAELFGRIPRFGPELRIERQLTPLQHNRYLHSLLNYFIFSIILIFGINFMLFVSCCCSAFRSRKRDFSRENRIVKVFIIGIVCLGVTSFSIGLIANDSLYVGTKELCHPFEEIGEKQNEFFNKTSKITNGEMREQFARIENEQKRVTDSLASEKVNNDLVTFATLLSEAKANIQKCNETLNEKILSEEKREEFELIHYYVQQCSIIPEQIRKNQLLQFFIMVLAFLPFLFVLIPNQCLKWFIIILGWAATNAVLFVMAFLFVVLIMGSDFCVDSRTLIMDRIHSPEVLYYLNCSNQKYSETLLPAKLEFQLHTAKSFLEKSEIQTLALNNTLASLAKLLCDNTQLSPVCGNIRTLESLLFSSGNSILSEVHDISNAVSATESLLSCTKVSQEIDFVINAICGPIFLSAFLLFLNTGIASASLIALFVLVLWLLYADKFDPLDDDEPEWMLHDRRRLAAISAPSYWSNRKPTFNDSFIMHYRSTSVQTTDL